MDDNLPLFLTLPFYSSYTDCSNYAYQSPYQSQPLYNRGLPPQPEPYQRQREKQPLITNYTGAKKKQTLYKSTLKKPYINYTANNNKNNEINCNSAPPTEEEHNKILKKIKNIKCKIDKTDLEDKPKQFNFKKLYKNDFESKPIKKIDVNDADFVTFLRLCYVYLPPTIADVTKKTALFYSMR